MKIQLCTAVLLCISFCSFSQAPAEGRVDIQNQTLIAKIEGYQAYIKTFAAEHKIKKYLISLKSESINNYNTITLQAIRYQLKIAAFNPSKYAVVKNMPVLIHDSFDDFVPKNLALIKYIETRYWADANQQPNVPVNSPDSITVNGKKLGGVLVSSSSVNLTAPKAWILTFKGTNLINETADRFEHQSQ